MAVVDPSSLTPEFLGDDRKEPALVGIITVTSLAGLVVLVRLYARWRVIKSFGWDDALICFAMALNITVMALSIKVLENGAGRHIYALQPDSMVAMFKWLVSAQLVYCIALWVCRMSGLAFYGRLTQARTFTLWLRGSMVFVTLVFIAQLLILALQCIPLSALWGETEGKCMGSKVSFISTAAMTIVCDSVVLLLPLSIVFRLHVSLKRKIALGIVLCFGVLAVATSVCRIISMVPAVTKEDATWYFSVVMVWSDTEISSAIVALSLPALKGLFSVFKEETKNSSNQMVDGSVRMKPLGSDSNKIYAGRHHHPAIASASRGDNTSEEVLWTDADRGEINVKTTVQVYVDEERRRGTR